MLTGESQHLKQWQMSMPPAQFGTFYFNFLSSHDGIGLRPAEGLLSEDDIGTVVNAVQRCGGRVSWRSTPTGKDKPYEINVTYFDALMGTVNGPDNLQVERFLCAHGIMFALEGIPAIYIHSLVACRNNIDGVELSGQNRSINRYKWPLDELTEKLNDEQSVHAIVFKALKNLLAVRTKQSAFHPNATQFTLHLGDNIFGFWRQSPKRDQSIFCIHNVSDKSITIPLNAINLIQMDSWIDLISGTKYSDVEKEIVLAPYQFVWLTNKNEAK
jgi:sucrose phosphorylase